VNPVARCEAMAMYDRIDINGTEQRAFAGNLAGHFDLPLRNCTVFLDARVIVERGVLQGELA
jgi:2,5-dihydroxypyridine 5,6-dioxygenase